MSKSCCPLMWMVVAVGLVLTVAAADDATAPATPANSLFVIQPYRFGGTWVFDDERLGLKKEPFVAGVPAILDAMVKDFKDTSKGFRLIFSGKVFPGAYEFERREQQEGGWWYYTAKLDKRGWLCPALFKYFPEAPVKLYAKAEPLTEE